MKKEIRVAGVDDSPFDKFKEKENLVVATIFRGSSFMDGLLSTKVEVDGDDSTDKLIEMFSSCKFKGHLRCIFLDGIGVAGFNVIDIKKLNKKTRIPVIVIMRNIPNMEKIKNALAKAGKPEKIKLMRKAGKITHVNNIYIQTAGINTKDAKEIIDICCTHSHIPEAVRIAHIIASGIKEGESRGRA